MSNGKEDGKTLSDAERKYLRTFKKKLDRLKSQGLHSSLVDELNKLDDLPERIREGLDQVKKKYARGGGVRKARYK
jgi:hypothetical protein